MDVASDGTVVGFSKPANGPSQPVVWGGAGAPTALPTSGIASAISRDGSTVVGYTDETISAPEAWRWTASGGVQTLAAPGVFRFAQDVSADGSVIVGSGAGGAVRWTQAGGTMPLGSQFVNAWSCSADGDVVVGEVSPFSPYRWVLGGSVLTPLGAWDRGFATAISANGITVVGVSRVGSSNSGARWSAASGFESLSLSAGLADIAVDLTADGRTIVGEGTSQQQVQRAIVWNEGAGYAWADDWLRSRGASIPAGWNLERVTAITDDGRFMAGYATNAAGVARAWRADLTGPLGERYCILQAPNSTGASAVVLASGSDVVADNDFTLHAGQLSPNAATLFLVGPTQGLVISPGGAQGNLCLAGGIGRFTQLVQVSDAAGYSSTAIDLTVIPRPGGVAAVAAGETWSFQAWFRDLNPGPTSNFTDALSVTFR